jgi:hypothetical protein
MVYPRWEARRSRLRLVEIETKQLICSCFPPAPSRRFRYRRCRSEFESAIEDVRVLPIVVLRSADETVARRILLTLRTCAHRFLLFRYSVTTRYSFQVRIRTSNSCRYYLWNELADRETIRVNSKFCINRTKTKHDSESGAYALLAIK